MPLLGKRDASRAEDLRAPKASLVPPVESLGQGALGGRADLRRAKSVPSVSALGATLLAAVAVWTGLVGSLGVWRHYQFLSHRFDLGNMVQAVWSTAHGDPLMSTDASGQQVVRLAWHVDPILALFTPAWWLYPAPETLILMQALALAAGVYPIVRLALKHVGSSFAACLLGAWYLTFPWVVWSAVNDFHPVALAIPLLLYSIWFLDQDRLGPFAVVAVLAMLSGELVGAAVAALGLWYAVRHRRIIAGSTIAVAASAWTVACLLVVIPAFGGRPSPFYTYFRDVGGSPTGVAATFVTDPEAILRAVTTGADTRYSLSLLLPTAFLALGSPILLLVALPQFAVNALADVRETTQPMYQYSSVILAPLLAATVVTIGRLPHRLRLLGSGAALAAGLICLAARPPLPGAESWVFGPTEGTARVSAMREALSLVPDKASVAATNRLGAHLSARPAIYALPRSAKANWVVIDTRDTWLAGDGPAQQGFDETEFRRLVTNLRHDGRWRLVFAKQQIQVYRRVGRPAP